MKALFKTTLVLGFTLSILAISGCKIQEGPGGLASISGKVYAYDYNAELTTLLNEGYVGEQDVYIMYGDSDVHNDDIQTHHDGTFRFDYLKKGTYTIYVYSKDSSLTNTKLQMVMTQTIEITDKKQDVILDDIVIWK